MLSSFSPSDGITEDLMADAISCATVVRILPVCVCVLYVFVNVFCLCVSERKNVRRREREKV